MLFLLVHVCQTRQILDGEMLEAIGLISYSECMRKGTISPQMFAAVSVLLLAVFFIGARWTSIRSFLSPSAKVGSAVTILSECEQQGLSASGRECYEAYLTHLLQQSGAEKAVSQLGVFEKESPIVKTYCHAIAHNLGHEGYKYYGNAKEALSQGSMDCFAGYFHGVLEIALPEAADYQQAIVDACTGTGGQDGEFRFYQCVHGLGHGVTAYRQYDVEKALSDCDLLASPWQKESCWGGVFMENIDGKFAHAMGLEQQGRLTDDGSDFWPCLSVGEGYRPACLRMITARILPKHGRDWDYTKKACAGLSNDSYRRSCFESYGRDAAGESLSAGLDRVNTLCDAAPADMRDTCYETAAAVVATHYADPTKADPICVKAKEYRSACEAGAKRIAESLAG